MMDRTVYLDRDKPLTLRRLKGCKVCSSLHAHVENEELGGLLPS